MKKIYMMLMVFATAAITLTSCSESNDAFFTATEDDYPRILNTDIPEAAGGERAVLPAITRDNNFVFEVIVTPADYTTVTWFIDGEQVYEGKTIDYPLIAGTYDVNIVATTTKGKSTQRLCSLEVLPLDGDPALAQDGKSLWCQIGTEKTIPVSNFEGIVAAYIGGQKLEDFKNNGSSITFTVPSLAEGDQKFIAETEDGTKFGCGNVNVSPDKYVEPGVVENTLWEGASEINWGDVNVTVAVDALADVPVGTIIKVYYEMVDMPDGYHALRITTPWWGDNASDQIVAQFDLTAETPNPYEFEYTEANKAIVDERGGMLFVGYGYKLTKVTYETRSAAAERTVWEGSLDINWGDVNIALDMADVNVGQTVSVYYDIIDMPDGYHAFRITTPWWGDNAEDQVIPQFDLTAETPNPYVFEYTEANKAIVDERGGMLFVGYGYRLSKVTVK